MLEDRNRPFTFLRWNSENDDNNDDNDDNDDSDGNNHNDDKNENKMLMCFQSDLSRIWNVAFNKSFTGFRMRISIHLPDPGFKRTLILR